MELLARFMWMMYILLNVIIIQLCLIHFTLENKSKLISFSGQINLGQAEEAIIKNAVDQKIMEWEKNHTEVLEKEIQLKQLKTQLNILEEQNIWFCTTLTLRYKIESVERISQPLNISVKDWDNFTRREKWRQFFNAAETRGFLNFVACIERISIDQEKVIGHINTIYGILNATVHNYLITKQISKQLFPEDSILQIAHCIDKLDVT